MLTLAAPSGNVGAQVAAAMREHWVSRVSVLEIQVRAFCVLA
jgi:hypothetical protein